MTTFSRHTDRARLALTLFFHSGRVPPFGVGVTGFGSSSGVSARVGEPEGPKNNNVYSLHAGVVGTSRDSHGAEGTSVNNIGVYGQTEELGAVPNLVAG